MSPQVELAVPIKLNSKELLQSNPLALTPARRGGRNIFLGLPLLRRLVRGMLMDLEEDVMLRFKVLDPHVRDTIGNNFLLLDDNAHIHRSAQVTDYLEKENIPMFCRFKFDRTRVGCDRTSIYIMATHN
ncbi:hypothetical protein NPIL_164561 [Nephila pilipes]|uniref:Tc1-like transposase DDE domain-containing protein n=1 Tax=Nephila pilipes TaxID=299642 RepID=A0A8X6Q8R2_NEPPI|nr:hypothetical protein NPIL_164561 [Nephila pilipes]